MVHISNISTRHLVRSKSVLAVPLGLALVPSKSYTCFDGKIGAVLRRSDGMYTSLYLTFSAKNETFRNLWVQL